MSQKNNDMRVLGLMSGTSLDGLDLCMARFWRVETGEFQFEIEAFETVAYDKAWWQQLKNASELNGPDLIRLDRAYGTHLGAMVSTFLQKRKIKPDFIASHGQTIFHRPADGFTLQIGHGGALSQAALCNVVCDFRSADVAAGGQGAPLVPIGEKYLFPDYSAFLNLGGFANIAIHEGGTAIAYDVCPVNYVANMLAQRMGKAYDDQGLVGAGGKMDEILLDKLNSNVFYSTKGPKSLGAEFVESEVLPHLPNELPVPDLLRTWYEHVALQLSQVMNEKLQAHGEVMVTGGGAYNSFLMKLMQEKLVNGRRLTIPTSTLIEAKEALIFAFLGYLYHLGIPNSMASVTGAGRDVIGGCLWKY